VGYVRK
jgi:hypothetical protein